MKYHLIGLWGAVAALTLVLVLATLQIDDLARDRPVPVSPAAPTATITETCNTTGVFRIVVVPGTGVAMHADPSCGTGAKP